MSLMLHCGAQAATRHDLELVRLPKATESYCPVPHPDLVDLLVQVGEAYLHDFSLKKSQFGLTKNGQQLFGVHTYHNGSTELGLSVGFRNSYDKSLSVGIAVGASVFVCDNLALTGDITVMRKHTRFVKDDLQQLVVSAILNARSAYYAIRSESQLMNRIALDNDNAHRLIGLLYGRGVVSPRQIPVVRREWLTPKHAEFKPRTVWSFYNAVTEALKSSPPSHILERHLNLNQTVNEVLSLRQEEPGVWN